MQAFKEIHKEFGNSSFKANSMELLLCKRALGEALVLSYTKALDLSLTIPVKPKILAKKFHP